MLSGLVLYLGTKNERMFIVKLIELKTFFRIWIMPGFALGFCSCLWFKKNESYEWVGDFMSDGGYEI